MIVAAKAVALMESLLAKMGDLLDGTENNLSLIFSVDTQSWRGKVGY